MVDTPGQGSHHTLESIALNYPSSVIQASGDGETIEATRLLVKRDKFEFKLNLMYKRNKYRYCEFILP
jgi:hypothetical protein